MNILSEKSWEKLIKEAKRITDMNEAEEKKTSFESEYDDFFYIKLLNYLEEKHCLGLGFHWGSGTYNEYYWWIEDRELGGTFTTLEDVVEDVLSKFLDVPARNC